MTEASAHHNVDWEPKRAVTLRAARRGAAFGRVLRWLFWIGAAAIAAVVGYYLFAPDPAPQAVQDEVQPAAEAGVVRMDGLRLSVTDDEGAPFQVLADTAIRRSEDSPNLLELDMPRLFEGNDLDIADLTERLNAERGLYDSDAKVLELYVDVDLETEDGYAFRTSHARYFVEEERAEGDEPVEVRGPFGTVSADRWSFRQDGEVLHFEGNVRTVVSNTDGLVREGAGR